MARTLSIFYGAFNVGFVGGSLLAGIVAAALGLAAPLFLSASRTAAGGIHGDAAFGFEAAFAIAVVPTVAAPVLAVRTKETLRSARAGS